MSRHQLDLLQCMKQPGIEIGKLCSKCDGRCPTCDSFVNPYKLVRICNDCSFGTFANRCIICGSNGGKNGEQLSDAHYCYECCMLERDRDGCPKIINIGSTRTDIHYEQKKRNI